MATKAKFYIATSNGWVEVDFGGSGNGSFYGVCNTTAGTSAKTVTGVEDFTLETGRSINVKFTNAYTSTTITPTLNINNTGAKQMRRNGSTNSLNWAAEAIIQFVYDGTYWVMIDANIPTTTSQLTNNSGFVTGQDVNQIIDVEYKPYWADQDTTYTKTEVDNLFIRRDTEATATTIGGVCISLSNGILYISTTPMTS